MHAFGQWRLRCFREEASVWSQTGKLEKDAASVRGTRGCKVSKSIGARGLGFGRCSGTQSGIQLQSVQETAGYVLEVGSILAQVMPARLS